MYDKLLGRKSRWNWGKNSKNELRLIEKRQFRLETHEELAQDKDEAEAAEWERQYQEWLKNYWASYGM